MMKRNGRKMPLGKPKALEPNGQRNRQALSMLATGRRQALHLRRLREEGALRPHSLATFGQHDCCPVYYLPAEQVGRFERQKDWHLYQGLLFGFQQHCHAHHPWNYQTTKPPDGSSQKTLLPYRQAKEVAVNTHNCLPPRGQPGLLPFPTNANPCDGLAWQQEDEERQGDEQAIARCLPTSHRRPQPHSSPACLVVCLSNQSCSFSVFFK